VESLAPLAAVCRPVPEEKIGQMLLTLAGGTTWAKTLPQTAQAIRLASLGDPLRPDREEGAEITACVLSSLAYVCSRLQPNAMRGGSMGLYGIKPGPGAVGNQLMLPRTASLYAVDLVRRSLSTSRTRTFFERLVPYFEENQPALRNDRRLEKSMQTLSLAGFLYDRFFWDGNPGSPKVARMLAPATPRDGAAERG
jgi:hypothetical protein